MMAVVDLHGDAAEPVLDVRQLMLTRVGVEQILLQPFEDRELSRTLPSA
jgi:hypothetical protein